MPGATIESISFNSSFRNENFNSNQVRTPRPLPQFFLQQQTFSTKKEKAGTPKDALPPRPPVKSVPPVSRIFPHRTVHKAQPVSFKAPDNSTPTIVSPHYNDASQELYFDQCFEIECKLGAGSFGDVFKVRSKEDGKFYAIKRSRERFRGESDRRRKLEEVAKHEKLRRHPNCVRFYKAWEEKQHLYLQTELCQTSLNNFAEKNHNIPERLIWNYIVDLLMAVKHIHDNDLVHMDIKPENIFISNDVCKLGDFGLVIDMGNTSVDKSEAMEGDPKYLAPELMRGRFDKSADIFSLGITLLELASDLDLPKGGELWHQLREGDIAGELLSDVSPQLKSVILSMMEPDPDKRPTADQLLNLPIMKTIWRKRRREQIMRHTMSLLSSVIQGIWSLLVTLWLTMTYPLHSLLPTPPHTPVKNHITQHPPDWDHSFSDDEFLGEDNISINNSLCAPLDFSTSSEDSVRDTDGFVVPSLPQRNAFTTPGNRNRQARKTSSSAKTSLTRSANSNQSTTSIFSSSPFSSPYQLHNKTGLSHTPNSSFHRSLLEDLEQDLETRSDSKLSIEPKNLMDAFEGASSDED